MEQKEEKTKTTWSGIINRIIGIEGFLMTGKYILLLVVSAMAIDYIIVTVAPLQNELAKAMIYSSLLLIPIYVVHLGIEEIYDGTIKDIIYSMIIGVIILNLLFIFI